MAGSPVNDWYTAAGDCEQVRSGLLGQPANTVSAAAYLLAGGWLLIHLRRPPAAPHRYRWFAAAVAANGVGSGLYHGPGWPGSGWCHDVTAVAVPVFIAVDGLGGIRGWDDRRITRVGLAVAAVAAAGVLTWPGTNLVLLIALSAAVLAEVALAHRAGAPAAAPPRAPLRGGAGRVVMLTALAVGVIAYQAGRTGGLLCRPGSLLQPHALWHLLTATAMAAWAADRTTRPPLTPTAATDS
jgi:hypothetical protein